ncbi:hypothetical protein [uncultured Alistipes sp.]|uniref:hypothetical protein n=1 Tax=uncultured Alistipes sp. TaxID=538949 RepID=UPI003208BAAA
MERSRAEDGRDPGIREREKIESGGWGDPEIRERGEIESGRWGDPGIRERGEIESRGWGDPGTCAISNPPRELKRDKRWFRNPEGEEPVRRKSRRNRGR